VRYRAKQLLTVAFWVGVVVAGVALAVAPVALPGLVLGGSACGGGGEEQVCLGIARELSLVEVSPLAWWWVGGGAALAAIGVVALVVASDRLRLAAGFAVVALAVTGLALTSKVDAKLGPEGGGTWGRSDEDWGRFLRPALLDLRADKRRELVGKRQRPGAPPYEREQTLETFSVLPRSGWKIVGATLVALLFASLFEVSRRLIRRPSLAFVGAATGGLLVWAYIEDSSFECSPDASECYRGLLTLIVVVGVAAAWAAYGIGIAVGRFTLPRLRRRA
jgi:hypothetical protein